MLFTSYHASDMKDKLCIVLRDTEIQLMDAGLSCWVKVKLTRNMSQCVTGMSQSGTATTKTIKFLENHPGS